MDIIQALIPVFGLVAIFLTQLACIFGLISQPFFLYSTNEAEQVGMFLLSICYTAVWVMGVKNYWFNEVETSQNIQPQVEPAVDYLDEIDRVGICIQHLVNEGTIDAHVGSQLLDLLNDAKIISDPIYCSNALFALKCKIIRLGKNLKSGTDFSLKRSLLNAIVILESRSISPVLNEGSIN